MTESSASPGPIVLWLSSRYENLELGQAVLEYVCRVRGIENDAEHWIGVALREALANAIKHGNQMKTSGRGIFYMKTFMDDVTFSRGARGGTILTMRKHLGGDQKKGVQAR